MGSISWDKPVTGQDFTPRELIAALNAYDALPAGTIGSPSGPVALTPPSLSSPVTIPGGTGAAQPFRLIGSTAPVGGPPTTGTFQPSDVVIDGTTLMVARSLYEQTVRNLNPRAYWRMNDAGTTALDQMGLYNGTLNGGVTTGVAGALTDGDAAMSFDGTTGYVSVPSFPAFTTGPFTLALWARIPTYSANRTLIGMVDSGAANFNFLAFYTSATVMRLRVGSTQATPSGTAFDDNLWHLWMFLVDASGNLGIYKDNTIFKTIAGPAATPQTTGVALALGRQGAQSSSYFNGGLDEIAIFPTLLGTTDRDALYNAGIASFPWAFETVASLTKAQTWTKPQTFQGALTLQAMPTAQAGLELSKIAAPATPAAGLDRVWVDSTSGALSFMGSDAQAIPVASGMIANPRTYLGKGDGVADDTLPLNNAYSAAGEGMKNMLYIPGGSWKYTSQLNWAPGSKDVLVMGAGIQVTELKPTAFGGSSLVLSVHTSGATEIGHLGITGPGTYTNPSSNPGNTAGVDGLELASAIAPSWIRIQNCGAGLVISGSGGHKRIFHSIITSNYYNIYEKYTGGDDFYIDVQAPSAMFAAFYTDDTDAGEDLGFSLGVIRVHCNAQPFVFYQAALTSKSNFATDVFAHHFSLEQICNGFMYATSFVTKGNAWGLHFVTCGTMSTNANFQRSDSPHDYMVVIGQSSGTPNFFWGWPTQSLDRGFLFSQNEFFNDWHFYGASRSGAMISFNGGVGQQLKWHPDRTDGMQNVATFGAASGTGATKVIGANSWPGPPASLSLQITPGLAGGLANSYNYEAGTVRATPAISVPQAPAPALIASAGNIDAGNHSYKFIHRTTGINGRAGNSGPSVATSSVTNDAGHGQNTVNLPANGITPVGAPTVTIEAYRNKVADQTHWFLVQNAIALGTASVVDNLADASLGAAMPTTADDVAWDATITLRTTAGQTGNPTFNWALKNQ